MLIDHNCDGTALGDGNDTSLTATCKNMTEERIYWKLYIIAPNVPQHAESCATL